MKHKLLDNNIKSMIIALRKKGRTEGKNYLVALSDMLDTSRRKRVKVNVYKLALLAKRHKDAIFLIPGTVLGYGILDMPINVYAFKYSKGAVDKILKNKGTAKTFEDLLNDELKGKNIMIIK